MNQHEAGKEEYYRHTNRGTNAVGKQGGITESINVLQSTAQELHGMVESLRERLTPVLEQTDTKLGTRSGVEIAPHGGGAPMVQTIEMSVNTMRSAMSMINDILNRFNG